MDISKIKKELENAAKIVEQQQQQESMLKGKLELKKEALKELGFNSTQEAREEKEKLIKQRDELTAQIKESYSNLKSKYPSLFA